MMPFFAGKKEGKHYGRKEKKNFSFVAGDQQRDIKGD